MLDPAITRHREATRCDAGQVTSSDSRHLAGLTEAQRDQAMARWQVLRPHIEDGLSQKIVPFSRIDQCRQPFVAWRRPGTQSLEVATLGSSPATP